MKNFEEQALKLIVQSGEARLLGQQSLELMRIGKTVLAKEKNEQAIEALNNGRKVHAELLRRMASGEEVTLDLLLIHAEDHIMSTQVYLDMVNELIYVYERMEIKDE